MNTTEIEIDISSTTPLITPESGSALNTNDEGYQMSEAIETIKVDWQVLQSGWENHPSNELEPDAPGEIAESIWATRTEIIKWIWWLAQNATKAVVVDGVIEEVSNDAVRMEAFKQLWKWHFDKDYQRGRQNRRLHVVLIEG